MPVSGQYGTMSGLAERSPLLFPPGEPSSSRSARVLEESPPTPQSSGDEMAEGDGMEDENIKEDDMEDEVSYVDSDDVNSVMCDMMSDAESTSLEADDDEDPHISSRRMTMRPWTICTLRHMRQAILYMYKLIRIEGEQP